MTDHPPVNRAPFTPPDETVQNTPEPRFAQLKVLWSFVRPHRRKLLLGLVLALFGSALELANPMVVKLVLDTVSEAGSLAMPIAILLCLFGVGMVTGLWHWIVLGTVAERVVLEARTSLVRRYFRAALVPLSRRPSGELVTRATSDTVLLKEAASSSIISLVNGSVLMVGTLIMMGVLDLVLLSVTVTAVVVVTVLFLTLMPAIAKAQEKAQNSLGLMGGVLDGSLRAIRTVKAGRAEERLGSQILRHAEDATRYGIRSVRREALAWTIAFGGVQLAIITILGVGALRVASGEIAVSTLVAFLLYAFTLMNPVMELSQSVTTLQSGIAAAKRIREVEAIPLEPTADAPATGDRPTPNGDGARASANGFGDGLSSSNGHGGPLLELHGVTARYAPGAATNNTIIIRSAVFDDLTFDGDEQAACQYEKFVVGRRLWIRRVLPFIESELANPSLSPLGFKKKFLSLTYKLEDSEKTSKSAVSSKCENPDSFVHISTQGRTIELVRELDRIINTRPAPPIDFRARKSRPRRWAASNGVREAARRVTVGQLAQRRA